MPRPRKADVFPIDEAQQRAQVERVRLPQDALATTTAFARHSKTSPRPPAVHRIVLYPMKTALSRLATLGEVADVLREEFGVYRAN